MTPEPIDLPVVGAAPRPPRADAVRNRQRILSAAQRLFACRGVDCVSMDDIAAEAEVGKGTLFRRFGDRASLVRALIEEPEAALQEAFIRGPAPLGPGAPPVERLVAFGQAVLDFVAGHGELVLAAEVGAPGRRYRSPVYGAYRAHVRSLLVAGAAELDADYLADALLAPLGAELIMHQLRGRGIPLETLRSGWEELARRVLG